MCYAPSVQWGKPSWFQSEVHSHWSTSSRMAFWDMCLVSSLPRHWAGIVSFRVSRRALGELERERDSWAAWVATEESGAQAGQQTSTDICRGCYVRCTKISCYVYCTTISSYVQRCCYGQCSIVQRSALDLICQCKIYSTVKDRPMHVRESSSWTKPHGELKPSQEDSKQLGLKRI